MSEETKSREKAVVKVIADMDAILVGPGSWIKGPMAAFKNGRGTATEDPKAVRFCLYGAMRRSGVPLFSEAEVDTFDYLEDVLVRSGQAFRDEHPIHWQEQRDRTFGEVKALLRSARRDYEPRFKS